MLNREAPYNTTIDTYLGAIESGDLEQIAAVDTGMLDFALLDYPTESGVFPEPFTKQAVNAGWEATVEPSAENVARATDSRLKCVSFVARQAIEGNVVPKEDFSDLLTGRLFRSMIAVKTSGTDRDLTHNERGSLLGRLREEATQVWGTYKAPSNPCQRLYKARTLDRASEAYKVLMPTGGRLVRAARFVTYGYMSARVAATELYPKGPAYRVIGRSSNY